MNNNFEARKEKKGTDRAGESFCLCKTSLNVYPFHPPPANPSLLLRRKKNHQKRREKFTKEKFIDFYPFSISFFSHFLFRFLMGWLCEKREDAEVWGWERTWTSLSVKSQEKDFAVVYIVRVLLK